MIKPKRSKIVPLVWAVCLAVLFINRPLIAQTVGEALPAWSSGVLDIHHINTGRGETAFLIMPDGTTMLIDAGDSPGDGPRSVPRRPDGSRNPGEWIARYISRMLSNLPEPALDYALLTHFHSDHMGSPTDNSKKSAGGDYLLVGITELGEHVQIAKIIDRGWPDYNSPPPQVTGPIVDNYRKFLRWKMEKDGLRVERFTAGRDDQIVLLNDPKKYPGFVVRNIAVNGEIWTGEGSETFRHVPLPAKIESADWEDRPSENTFCTVMRFSYGEFDYYTGGDIPGYPHPGAPAWGDMETPVARVVGPVDVHVLNHHGFHDSANEFFLSKLQPRVHIVQVLGASHLSFRVFSRLSSRKLYPGPKDIFATNLHEAMRVVLGANNVDAIKSTQGHIVVRVAPGGSEYRVIVLDDSAETYRVKSVHGPYKSS